MDPHHHERRGFERLKGYGLTLLVPEDADDIHISGVLIDVNVDGFRSRHPYSGFKENDTVRFLHRSAQGRSRVIWNHQTGTDFETGFAYLETSPSE
jgi:hypothetical protein